MPLVYVHLASGDLDEKLTKVHAGKTLEPPKLEFTAIKCPRCRSDNTPGTGCCGRCGSPRARKDLVRAAVRIDALKQQAGETVEIRELIRQIGPSELKKLKEPLTTAANRTYLIDLFEILQ